MGQQHSRPFHSGRHGAVDRVGIAWWLQSSPGGGAKKKKRKEAESDGRAAETATPREGVLSLPMVMARVRWARETDGGGDGTTRHTTHTSAGTHTHTRSTGGIAESLVRTEEYGRGVGRVERMRSLIGPALRERRRSTLHLPKTRGPKVRGLVVARAAAFAGQQGWKRRLAGESTHADAGARERAAGQRRTRRWRSKQQAGRHGQGGWGGRRRTRGRDRGREWDGAERLQPWQRAAGREGEMKRKTRTHAPGGRRQKRLPAGVVGSG